MATLGKIIDLFCLSEFKFPLQYKFCLSRYHILTHTLVNKYSLKMPSVAQSDTESNVSGFIRYTDRNFMFMYKSMIENMVLINRDIQQIENNLKNIVSQAGPMENQLQLLLQTLPKPKIELPMETD